MTDGGGGRVLTVVIVSALGILLAPTDMGQGILNVLQQLTNSITGAGQ
ncbi:hypothetical protein [Streptomyces sp. NPDC058653]